MMAYRMPRASNVATNELSACLSVCPLGGKELSASDTPLLPVEIPKRLSAATSLLGFRADRRHRARGIEQLA
jgi:hypothetical protein